MERHHGFPKLPEMESLRQVGPLLAKPVLQTTYLLARSAVIVDQLMVPAPVNQQSKPQENNRISFRVQIPPLPLPVNESTPDVALNTQYSLENITHVQKDVYRIAWKYLFVDALIDAERWSAISVQNGVSVYESREIYYGALSPLVKSLFGTGLQQAFEAQGAALKLLLEK